MKKIKIFLGAFVNYQAAQNINCRSLSKHLDKDKFEVYHRLYDTLNITVVSDKNTVGYYDMDSKVRVTDV